jgi:class 3 adenylate cyclase
MSASGLVTILFTDLVGSTAMAQEIGDDAADEVRRAHFEQLRRATSATGGTEVKTIGDAMMVSYTSAADAVAGAVAMQQRVHTHNVSSDGARIEMRIGVSAGDATFEDGDWFGTPVVEAARLCSAAGGGQILVADIVRMLAGSRTDHQLVAVGEVEGKGLAAPISACEVSWTPTVDSDESRLAIALPPQVEQGDVFGFVGREDQYDALIGAWKTVMADGRLAVFVGGEPGIGKTRLVKEFCRAAHGLGGVVLWGACDEEIGIPYQPFVEAFGWLANQSTSAQLAEILGPRGSEMEPLIRDLHQLVPGLDSRLSDDPDTERYRLFEATTELLANLSARAPVVIVLDDVHWARKPTLLLLRHLLKSSSHLQLMIVATYRDTDLDRTHPLAEMLADMRRQAGVERLMLHGLDEFGVRQFFERTAGHDLDEPGLALARAVAAETEGNPFFIGEVLRHLSESGALVYRDGRWTSDRTLGEVGIPEGVREVIGRRLSHLDPGANEVLACAAVIGREFDIRLLGRIVDGGPEAALDAIASAETSGLVEAVHSVAGRYRFSHALVRSTLYDELPTTRRLRLHRATGLALEASGVAADRVSELARHFTEAAALGEIDKALDYGRQAGDRALADLAFEEAASYYEQALDVLDLVDGDTSSTRGALFLAAGSALHMIGDPRGADLLAEAESIGRARNDIGLLARITVALCEDFFVREAGVVNEHHVELAEHVLDRRPELSSEQHAEVLAALSTELYWAEDTTRRRVLSDESLAIARGLGNPKLLASVLRNRSVVYDLSQAAAMDQVRAEASEMVKVAEGIDDVLLCNGYMLRGSCSMVVGEAASADSDLAEGERLAERIGIPMLVARAKTMRAARALLAGRLDECAVLVADMVAYCEREGIQSGPASAASINYRLSYERGDLAPLEDLLVAIIASQPTIPVWRMALCGVYLQTDRHELARHQVEVMAVDDFAMVPRNAIFLLTCSSAARIASQVGAHDVAAAAYRYASPFDDQFAWSGVTYEYPIGVGVGAAAGALGWYDKAERHFQQSLDLCERAGAPTYLAATKIHWAEMLVAREHAGDLDRARVFAHDALAIANPLGLAYVRKRAGQVLDRVN